MGEIIRSRALATAVGDADAHVVPDVAQRDAEVRADAAMRIDASAEPPTPTIAPKAAVMLIMGIQIPSAVIASGPTP
jgi:hypothetical protein